MTKIAEIFNHNIDFQMEDAEQDESGKESESESYGFEMPDDLEKSTAASSTDEVFEARDNVPTPLQDEVDVQEPEEEQQPVQPSPPKVTFSGNFLNPFFSDTSKHLFLSTTYVQ
jgi:hypothetical protein